MAVQSWAVLIGSFLLGAIPSAYLIARVTAGVDIRTVGDGNVGARNVYMSVGRWAGVAVAVFDIGKGAAAVVMARALGESEGLARAAGLAAVLGHDFTPFLNFHGGQGMAAILGIFALFYPWELAAALFVAAVVWVIAHHWDLSWFVAFGFFAASLWFTGHTVAEALYPVFMLPTIGLKKALQVWQAYRAAAVHQ